MRNKYDDGTPIEWTPVAERTPDDARTVWVKGVWGKKRRPFTGLATYSPTAPHWESSERGEGGSFYVGVTHWAPGMPPVKVKGTE